MSGRCSFARASGLEASGVLAQFLAPDALEIVRDALRSEEAWIRFLQPSSRMGEHAARLRVRALLFDPSLPRACDSSDAARVDPDGWGASLGSDVAGWARASVRLPHDDVYHTLEEDEEDWERARAAGALPSRRDRPDVSAPLAPSSHPAPRVRVHVDVLDDAARVRLSIATTEDPLGDDHPAAASPAADAADPLVSAVARDDDDPTTRAWRGATARVRVARVDAARLSVADDDRVSDTAASRRPAPPPRTPAGMRAYLLGGDAARTTAEDVGRADRFPELAGLRSTVPPFPSTMARARRASEGETRPGNVSSAPVDAMSEADASATLARVVAEALLRPTDTDEEPTVPDRRLGDEETTTTTTAAESAVVDALVAAAGNLARSIARRLRVALDARATRARTAARWDWSNGASAAAVEAPCVATLAVRAAVAGGEATPASLIAYRRRGALERDRLAARVAATKVKAEGNAAVKATEAAAHAERPAATTEPTADPAPFASADFPFADALGFDATFASRPGSPSVTLPLGHPGRVPSPHLPALDAFVLAKQPAAAAATSAGAAAASGGPRLTADQLASLHAQFRAKGLQLTAANVRRYELLLQQQMAAMRHQGMGQGMGQGMVGGATAGAERMFAPPRPMSPGTHVVTGGKREGTAAGGGPAKRGRLD